MVSRAINAMNLLPSRYFEGAVSIKRVLNAIATYLWHPGHTDYFPRIPLKDYRATIAKLILAQGEMRLLGAI